MASVYVFHFLLFSHLMLLLLASEDRYGNQVKCPPSFHCGHLGNISYPFTVTQSPHCGLFVISNCDNRLKSKDIQLENNGKWFWVIGIIHNPPTSPNITIQIRDYTLNNLMESRSCEAFSNNYTLPTKFPFGSIHIAYSQILLKCNRSLHVEPPQNVHKYTNCSDYDLYYKPSLNPNDESLSSLVACTMVKLPIKDVADAEDPFTFITSDMIAEVQLSYECANCYYVKRGQCHLDNSQKFCCINGYEKTGMKLLIVATAASLAGVAVLIILAYRFRTKIFLPTYLLFWKGNPTNIIIEKFLKEHGDLPTTRYNYAEVKKMTNSFRNKLGQGGFGCVYKGKLQDGRDVAVKVLTESKADGEDFINEVASISRTSHVNIVRLLGFSLNGSKRALIYEFMPNGSLEKFIYEEKKPSKVDLQIDCQKLYEIAIGVARGLEYLHRGCNTRILHFDIKPHNILLDKDFCPKISDFGLAKIYTRKESIVSIFGARGTAGYIAPELFSRNFGGVSHKSDVYSYGMMVLEMVGQRKNINVAVDRSSELYFPHWIYKRLELNELVELQCIKNESDEEMVRKMSMVSLRCIQTNPSNRPAMGKVVEMLEGSSEVLQIPPKPFLSSPSTSPTHLNSETCSLSEY
ncbi:putative glycerophosphodiester phosphodiesterase, protein kinase RLK-Pelle-LRK10L-2 family [Lupinus albus]|uniref:Putative glycerophosphodiester phosphodiesterase, protein kinase RLK-Pelle-LRK10L-2 family n=1 Tax=Lupinus albus TaxID=3870 RepID=A0A6A4QDS1_LUPAL|nr:putative glycerophosphodiester phosphodiesterase, protein kinase RLK-Pelle-LRK10L-2 family [Lupinus albus]